MVNQSAKDFFISYTKQDVGWASWVADIVASAGYTVTFQEKDFRPGENFVRNMHDAIRQSDRMLIVLSRAYLNSRFCYDEWTAFIARHRKDSRNGRTIPILVDSECTDFGYLAPLIFIDLTACGDDSDLAARYVIEGISPERRASSSPPAFPGKRPEPKPAMPENGDSGEKSGGDKSGGHSPGGGSPSHYAGPIDAPAIVMPPTFLPTTPIFPGVAKPQGILQTFFTIVLEGPVQTIDRPTLNQTLGRIKAVAKDDNITLAGVTMGTPVDKASPTTVRLHLLGTPEGFGNIVSVVGAGKLYETAYKATAISNLVDGSVTYAKRSSTNEAAAVQTPSTAESPDRHHGYATASATESVRVAYEQRRDVISVPMKKSGYAS